MMTIFSHSPGAGFRTGVRELASDGEELLLVAPDEEHFEELELEVATIGFALDRDAHQVGGLVVQTIGHVEIGFRQRIALVEIDGGFAADGFVGTNRRRERDVLGFLQRAVRARFLDEDVVGNRAHVRRAHAAGIGQRIHGLSEAVFALLGEAAQVVVELGGLALAARLGEQQAEDDKHAGGEHPPVSEQGIDASTDPRLRQAWVRRLGSRRLCGRRFGRRLAQAPVRQRCGAGTASGSGVAASGCGSGCSTGVWVGAGAGAGCAAAGCCCEAANLACRSASSVLRSSSRRLDSVSSPSSSRTRPWRASTSAALPDGRPGTCSRVTRRHQAQAAGTRLATRGGPGTREAAHFAAGFRGRDRGDFFAARDTEHGTRTQAIHVAFEGAGVATVDRNHELIGARAGARGEAAGDRRQAVATLHFVTVAATRGDGAQHSAVRAARDGKSVPEASAPPTDGHGRSRLCRRRRC